jgi:hypothetical protein
MIWNTSELPPHLKMLVLKVMDHLIYWGLILGMMILIQRYSTG